jgi:hypothetical protein
MYLRRVYRISVAQYDWLADQQGGKCALCMEPETRISNKTGEVLPLGIDHDHGCLCHDGKQACPDCIRGLLCDHCNLLIGKAEQRPVVALRFQDYLDRRPFVERR